MVYIICGFQQAYMILCLCTAQLKSDLKKTEEDLAFAKGEAESVVKERHEKVHTA